MREYYGTKQGKRPVLHELQTELEKLDLRAKMAKITGLSPTKIQRIERMGEKGLLDYADAGQIPITALYNSMEAKNNDVSKYTAEEVISLEPICCKACHQATGKIVFTRYNELRYKAQTDESQILF